MVRTVLALALAAGTASAQLATIDGSGTVNGNGNSGFGGVIGTGSLNVTTAADGTVTMSLARGNGGFFDLAVIYIDSLAGGITNTSQINDTQDGGRAGISGNGFGGQTSDLGFASGFGADYGITMESAFSGIFDLNSGNPANLGFVAGVSTDAGRNAQSASFNIAFNLSQIGLAAGDSFRLVVTYLNSGNAFRSGEFIGSAAAGPFAAGSNIGQNPFNLGSNDFILVNSVPAPGTLALLGLGGLAAARRRR